MEKRNERRSNFLIKQKRFYMKSKIYEKDNYKVVVYGTPDLLLIPKDKIDLLASVLEAIICEMVKEDDLNDRTRSDKA